MSLIAELKRRNVIRMAGLYLVGAWLLTQVAATLLPVFEAPAWVMKALVGFLALAFIPAIIFSWIFELTPDGLKRDSEVPEQQSIAPQTARRMERLTLLLFAIALAFFGFDKFVLAPKHEKALVAEAIEKVEADAANAAPRFDSKSIAVLPFENLSEEKSNAYFAEGIQDEILTRLSKIGALKVISRTSTQRYASSPENVAEIAAQLGVANLLEGSVQKVGNKVRINVQLIRADTDTHLWAEIYDRDVADIFAVQSEIANAVTTALSATLTGEERKDLAQLPTRNVAAYDAYLRGISFRIDNGWFAKRRDAFKLATQLDPGFLQAWAELAQAQMVMDFLNIDTSAEGRALTTQALAQAVQLDPEAVPTQLALAYHKYWIERDYPAAAKLFQNLSARMPNSSDIPFALSRVTRRQMQWDQSLRYSKQAIALDPRNVMILGERGETYSWLRNYPEAIKAYQAALAVAPNDAHIRQEMIFAYQNAGRLDEAQKLLDQLPADEQISARVAQLSFRGNYPQAIALLKSKPVNGDDNYVLLDRLLLGLLQVRSGDMDAARQTLSLLRKDLQAAAQREPDNANIASLQGQTFALLGDKELALAAGRRAIQLLPVEVDPIFAHAIEERMAFIEAQVGEHESAIARLTRLLKTPYAVPITAVALRLDPGWQPLRADPAFQKMLSDAERAPGEKR